MLSRGTTVAPNVYHVDQVEERLEREIEALKRIGSFEIDQT